MEKDIQISDLLKKNEQELIKELLEDYGIFEAQSLNQKVSKYKVEINDHISNTLIAHKNDIVCELEVIKLTESKYSDIDIQNSFHSLDSKLDILERSLITPFEELSLKIKELKLIERHCFEAEQMLEFQKYFTQCMIGGVNEDYILLGK